MRYSAKELFEMVEAGLSYHMFSTPYTYDDVLEEAQMYSLSAGGKRIRPCILLAVCEMLGGDADKAEPFAVALEYIHTYSLIHDDLPAMDDDDMRRGKPSNHKVYGEDIAILAGDALLTQAFCIMSEQFAYVVDSNVFAMGSIAACAYDMVRGQTADIKLPEEINDEYYEFVHKNKTAALFVAAFTAGAYLANSDAYVIDDMLRAGELYGQAFQLMDDMIDFDSDNEINYASYLGKEKAEEKVKACLGEVSIILDKYENNETLKELLGI